MQNEKRTYLKFKNEDAVYSSQKLAQGKEKKQNQNGQLEAKENK